MIPLKTTPIIRQGVRFFIYALSAFLIAELIRFDAQTGSIDTKFSENSYTEYMQSIFLLISSILLFVIYRRPQPRSYLALLLFAFTSVSFIREQDVYFENLIGQTSWFIPVLAILISTLYLVIRNWKTFVVQLNRYRHTFSAGLLTSGIITTYIFSRLFGRRIFWEAVMEGHYFRGVKNAAEECLELYGYLFILIAVMEFFIAERKLRKDDITIPNTAVKNNIIPYIQEHNNHKEPLPY
ncbi:hypothetical protein FXV77_06215 [Sphingobacterium phlebotomi]|uniref:Uncharacterized protein n=1 Tax=Sphingobacterium phlebotomi TaxID=2605433 RepID=A0A5D4HCQ4_9SPHI|nr:hypothetical protein [Sphingobacterium phlebotomi]TYR37589.1 hypothetical protein FXV77_06215 [Sphingobacterium phlebotomi]